MENIQIFIHRANKSGQINETDDYQLRITHVLKTINTHFLRCICAFCRNHLHPYLSAVFSISLFIPSKFISFVPCPSIFVFGVLLFFHFTSCGPSHGPCRVNFFSIFKISSFPGHIFQTLGHPFKTHIVLLYLNVKTAIYEYRR